jgi:hypothetical protein
MVLHSKSGNRDARVVRRVIVLVIALCAAPAYANQPNMEAALRALQQARSALERATLAHDGANATAIASIDQASNAVRAGIAVGARGGAPETTKARPVSVVPLPPAYADQIKIEASLVALGQAKAALERATPNHGNYRVQAIELIDQAIATVRRGVVAAAPVTVGSAPRDRDASNGGGVRSGNAVDVPSTLERQAGPVGAVQRAAPYQLPSPEQFAKDMKGVNARDTLARIDAAFNWLTTLAEPRPGDPTFAGYRKVAADARDAWHRGTSEGTNEDSLLSPCEFQYMHDKDFGGAVADRYFSRQRQASIFRGQSMFPPVPPPGAPMRQFPQPVSACTQEAGPKVVSAPPPFKKPKKTISEAKAEQAAAAEQARAEQAKADQKAAAERAEAEEKARQVAEESARAAAEAARRVRVNIAGAWSGFHDCRASHHSSALFDVSVEGRSVRAVKVSDDECGPAKSLSWEGELPLDDLTVGDLPVALHVRITDLARQKEKQPSTRTETLTITSPNEVRITSFPTELRRGDVRKKMEDARFREGLSPDVGFGI